MSITRRLSGTVGPMEKRKPRPAVREMSLAGMARLGFPPEEWAKALAAALVMDLCEEGRLVVALPDRQVAELVAEVESMALKGTAKRAGEVRVTTSPHRPGWTKVVLEIEDGKERS